MAIYQIHEELEVAASLEQVWDFISSPKNLKEITPNYMGFEITSPGLPHKIYPGLMISYEVRPVLGIKMNWLTDLVTYRLPAGPLGTLAHGIFIQKQLKGIFQHKELALEKRFGRP